jgi:peptidoglycan hydrolase-like protein with peptidoglycan-binding domain
MNTLKTLAIATALCALTTAAQAEMSGYNSNMHGSYNTADTPNAYDTTTTAGTAQTEVLAPMHVRRVQEALSQRGFYNGRIDGIWGEKTSAAIRRYQRSVGNEPNGLLTTTTLDNLGVHVDDDDRMMER